ncbi:hypothetical protein HDU98_008514 [Podochytrium sp. JEL0797]|nr:hypothetical protein HDU98_008514 [Podochytrium sp. JEL0797]
MDPYDFNNLLYEHASLAPPLPYTFDANGLQFLHNPRSSEYIDSIRAFIHHFGAPNLASLDTKGFTILHYVAGMETLTLAQVHEIVQTLVSAWKGAEGVEGWEKGNGCPHPLMLVGARPEGGVDGEEEMYWREVGKMKGFGPLAVATRGACLNAIRVFMSEMNACPFSAVAVPQYVSKYEIHLSDTSALQVALDYGLGNSLHTLLDSSLPHLRASMRGKTVLSSKEAASKVLSPKMKARTMWPELLDLNDEGVVGEDEEVARKSSWDVWDVRDAAGVTPLHAACGSKLSDEIALNMIQILLHHNVCSLFTRDCSGRTLLILSVITLRSPAFLHNLLSLPQMKKPAPPVMVRILRKLRPNTTIPNRIETRKWLMQVADWETGRTPLEWANIVGGKESGVAKVLNKFL